MIIRCWAKLTLAVIGFFFFFPSGPSRDHNRETVLQHIRQAHYQPAAASSSPSNPSSGGGINNNNNNTTSLTLVSQGLTSGGQMAVAGGAATLDALLPPPAIAGSSSSSSSSAQPAFRCGVCNQVSNWKHVIQVAPPFFSFPFNFFRPPLDRARKRISVCNRFV